MWRMGIKGRINVGLMLIRIRSVLNIAYTLGRNNAANAWEACPYMAPQFREERDSRMEKCDLCLERWSQGQKPTCVDSCPTRALDAGPLEELQMKYGNTREAEGFTYRPGLNHPSWSNAKSRRVTEESIIEKTSFSGNLP